MSSVFQTAQKLVEHVNAELKNFCSDVNVHMVWLQEIQQEAYRMFSSDFSTEPELMPKTPSQKKTNRRRRLSVELNESRSKRRFSKGKRSNLRGSSVQSSLSGVSELESVRRTRRQRKAAETPQEPEEEEEEEEAEEISAPLMLSEALEKGPGADAVRRVSARRSLVQRRSLVALRHSLTQDAVRRASRRSFLKKKAKLSSSTCSSAFSDAQPEDAEVDAEEPVDAEQQQEAVMDTKPPEIILPSDPEPPAAAAAGEEENEAAAVEENHSEPDATSPAGEAQNNSCFTRSMKRQSDSSSSLTTEHRGKRKSGSEERLTRSGSKRRVLEEVSTPKSKNPPLGKKCLTSVAPHMRAFVHTVQKNQMLMTPGSLGRSSVMKSFIKVPRIEVKVGSGAVEQERQKWDAFNKKIELENERKKRMEEEKRKKQEEMKRKRDERVKRVVETRVKGEKEKELEKKKKIEEKIALLEKKSDMLRVERMAEEKNKKMVATKRQEELELRKKREEAARLKKLQQVEEEERRHQEMLSTRKAEEERERARKQAEATRALELKEQEREKEREREREREKERLETEKELELRRKMMQEEQKRVDEEKEAERRLAAAALVPPAGSAQVLKTPAVSVFNQTITKSPALNLTFDMENSLLRTPDGKGASQNKTMDTGAGLNVTVDIEKSPQTYQITPKGQRVSALVNPEDYGMDQQSDDSTDDESDPKKPIPSWAQGTKLQQCLMKQYYQPPDLDSYFGEPEPPRLEDIFSRAKPRFFKRTSSAVWHTPPNTAL